MSDGFMNMPEFVNITEADIVREYRGNADIKAIAKMFCMNTNKVKGILRQAGVLEGKKNPGSKLQEIGINEKDFL